MANITVGHGDGLFSHARYDRSEEEEAENSNSDSLPRLYLKGISKKNPPFRKIRVVFVHHGMWIGGVERQILFLCKGLIHKKNIEFSLALFMERGELAPLFEKIGIPIKVIPVYDKNWAKLPNFEEQKTKFAEHLRKFDVIHCWYGGGDLGSYQTFPSEIGHIAGVHVAVNMAWTVHIKDSRISAAIMENDRLQQLHQAAARIYHHAPGLDLPAIFRIDVGVDIDAFPFVDRSNRFRNKVVVGRISRLVPEKDPSSFVAAAAIILSQRNDVIFQIYGDGSEMENLVQLAKDLEISPSDLEFRGMTSEVSRALSDFDIFAYPTLGDSVGWVVLEAMASGLPIISTDIDAVPTFVKSDNGILVDVKDVESLASAIDFLVENRDVRLEMGRRSRDYVETRFRQDRYLKEYEELYQHLGNTRYVKKKRHLASI